MFPSSVPTKNENLSNGEKSKHKPDPKDVNEHSFSYDLLFLSTNFNL